MFRNCKWYLRIIAAIGVLSAVMPMHAQTRAQKPRAAQWKIAGRDLNNTRNQPAESSLSPANVAKLTTKWVFTTGGDVSATPTVANGTVYFPDWAGNLYALNQDTGALIWSHKISDYDGFTGAVSRGSPAIDGSLLIFGDLESYSLNHDGANVIAVDNQTGALKWITKVEGHPAAIITGSPVVYGGVVYVGVSSVEETLGENPAYQCCSFRGSVVALDEATGIMLWQTYDMPDNGGRTDLYSGGSVWQPPVIDPRRGWLYIGTGNNYTTPADVEACQNADAAAPNCAAGNDHFDSALALDLKTGAIQWHRRLQGSDTWTIACLLPGASANPNCPVPTSPDFDLGGSGANFLGYFVGFGQKSGIYWALDPATGKVLWSTPVGPGGPLGGIEWGTATDGQRIYVAISNSNSLPYTLMSGQKITGGAWTALDVTTGKILWQTADPTPGGSDRSSVSVANGVMYAGSYSGTMYALSATTGQILWSFASGGSVVDGPSIVDGTLYWGSGYSEIAPGTGNNKLYAFSLPN